MQDPHLGGNSVQEAEARKKHAQERQQQAIKQAALDREHRVEDRWPWISPNGKVCSMQKPALISLNGKACSMQTCIDLP